MAYKVVVAMPAYNEAENISDLLNKILRIQKQMLHPLKILVINDGSTDQTEKILEEYAWKYSNVKYVSFATNQGLGNAMQTIINYACDALADEDILITIDADNTHNPKIIPSMIKKLEENNLDVVIASRFIRGSKEIGLPALRKIYSRGAVVFFKLFFPIQEINDYSCGFRAYRVRYLKKAKKIYQGKLIKSKGFESMAEILACFSKIGVKAAEYPLVLEYNLKKGESKMKVFHTVVGYFSLLKRVKNPAPKKLL